MTKVSDKIQEDAMKGLYSVGFPSGQMGIRCAPWGRDECEEHCNTMIYKKCPIYNMLYGETNG